MRLWFFGSGAFGVPTLARLAEAHDVLGVVSQPDRPAGRGRKLTPNPVAAWTLEHLPDAALIRTENVSRERPEPLVDAQADAWVVIAFGQKLSESLLGDRFAINLHASLLPRWRGAAPINAAMIGGDEETGNSVIALADRMDAGVVFAQSSRGIERSQTAGELHDLLSEDGPDLVLGVLDQLQRGALSPAKQDESLVTLAPKLSRETAAIDWTWSADRIRRTINGLSPWPGVSVSISGVRVKLLRADSQEPLDGAGSRSAEPGSLVDADQGLVAAGDGGLVRLLEVTPAGKRPMAWSEFARGHRIVAGESVRVGADTP